MMKVKPIEVKGLNKGTRINDLAAEIQRAFNKVARGVKTKFIVYARSEIKNKNFRIRVADLSIILNDEFHGKISLEKMQYIYDAVTDFFNKNEVELKD